MMQIYLMTSKGSPAKTAVLLIPFIIYMLTAKTAVLLIPFLINMLTALKGSQFYFYSVKK